MAWVPSRSCRSEPTPPQPISTNLATRPVVAVGAFHDTQLAHLVEGRIDRIETTVVARPVGRASMRHDDLVVSDDAGGRPRDHQHRHGGCANSRNDPFPQPCSLRLAAISVR
jgi:hypothetical protein